MNKSSKNHVYHAWLKSEAYRMISGLGRDELQLIENPDFNNDTENNKREKLLFEKFGRSAILNNVPASISWCEVELEDKDLNQLHILMIWDWFLDTGRTFKLSEVASNLASGHGHKISNFPPGVANHKVKIDEMSQHMNGDIQDIVMISTSETGPFTIIDGTHRSSLLALKKQISGTKAYLGIAQDLSRCVWAPEWENYQQNLSELNKLVDNGFLW